MAKLVWHYTYGDVLPQIMADGFLRRTDRYIGLGEKPILWFSTNQFWEETFFKGQVQDDGSVEDLGFAAMINAGIVLYRIGVAPETVPLTWADLKEMSREASGLVRSAREWHANPREWRGTFDRVPRDKWLAVEVQQKGRWVPFDHSSDSTSSPQ